jgi:glucose-6-phosphate 1-dehydrogenase
VGERTDPRGPDTPPAEGEARDAASEPLSDPSPGGGRAGDPCVMVIFGATGDLTKRKLVPALINLAQSNLLSHQFAVVGFAVDDLDTEGFRKQIGEEIAQFATGPVSPDTHDWLVRRLYYVRGDFQDPKAYQRLAEQTKQAADEHGIHGSHLYYLAVAPRFFGEIVRRLGEAGLSRESDDAWRRVVVEKPFGHDLDSARALNAELQEVLAEDQIYRIDHYLGKETVQNILVFRFANGIFEPIWNRRYIDHVQISAAETVGVEQRGGYYEHAGALRDMVPNHLFQLVSLTAMEPPISFDANAVRDEQAKVLHAMQSPSPEEVLSCAVRGQYGDGRTGDQRLPAYRSEPGVTPDSSTETFVALKLGIDNWRWADVPFYLRTGKRLPSRSTEIAIQFRRAPFRLFRDTPVEALSRNRLVIRIQPDEGIALRFGAKIPGAIMRLGAVDMDFDYRHYFGATPSTGYERLIHDCMTGDATLFQRADMVEAGWSVIEPILDVWKALPPRAFPNYPAGTWGPKEADELLSRDGREWHRMG